MAEIRKKARLAIGAFAHSWVPKYPKAVQYLTKDRRCASANCAVLHRRVIHFRH